MSSTKVSTSPDSGCSKETQKHTLFFDGAVTSAFVRAVQR